MAVSNSYDFQLTRNTMIDEAYRLAGIIDQANTPTSTEYTNASQSLNIIIKNLMTKGLRLWRYEDVIFFPLLNTNKYELKATTARIILADQFVRTAVNGTFSSGASVVTVDSATGIGSSSEIGFYNPTTKAMDWYTVSSVSTNDITLSTTLSSALSDDTLVYSYPSTTSKPLRISDATLQINATSEIVMRQIGQRDYTEISYKKASGNPTQFFYKPNLQEGDFYIWPQVDDESKYINMVIERQFDDLDTSTDNPATPAEYYDIIIYCLGSRLAMQYGFFERANYLQGQYEKLIAEFSIHDRENASLVFGFEDDILGGY